MPNESQALARATQGVLATRSLTPDQLALLKRTAGGGNLTNDEFSLYIETARHLNLDPFKKQIVPIVFGGKSKDPSKRRVEYVVTQQGYRSRAVSSGTWGPWHDEEALRTGKEPLPNPQVFFNEALIDPDTNPMGIDYAVYYCKKYRTPTSDAFDIVQGKARWVERVPLKEIWAFSKEKGKEVPTGTFRINSDSWVTQPVHMIGKCAECDALRRGWPDETAGLYTDVDMDRTIATEEMRLASQVAEEAEAELRMKRIGTGIPIIWAAGDPIVREDKGGLVDKILAWLQKQENALAVQKFEERNLVGLQDIWAQSKSDGLALREALDKRIKELSVVDVEGDQGEPAGGESTTEGPAGG